MLRKEAEPLIGGLASCSMSHLLFTQRRAADAAYGLVGLIMDRDTGTDGHGRACER